MYQCDVHKILYKRMGTSIGYQILPKYLVKKRLEDEVPPRAPRLRVRRPGRHLQREGPLHVARGLAGRPLQDEVLFRQVISHIMSVLRVVGEEGKAKKGPSIKDVRTGRGRGGSPKAYIIREVAWIYYCRPSPNASRKFCGRPLCMVPKYKMFF